jgi:hypothetical protein
MKNCKNCNYLKDNYCTKLFTYKDDNDLCDKFINITEEQSNITDRLTNRYIAKILNRIKVNELEQKHIKVVMWWFNEDIKTTFSK